MSLMFGLWTFIDTYLSYKKGIFKEYRKMAPYIYHYRGDNTFIPKIVENILLGGFLIGFAVWLWFDQL